MNTITLTYIHKAHAWYISTTESYLGREYIYKLDDNDLLDVLREHRIDVGSWIIPVLRSANPGDIVITTP